MTSLSSDPHNQDEEETAKVVNALGYPLLQPRVPVPSDIDISKQIVQEVKLLPIQDVAKQYVVPCSALLVVLL
jgi:hypothetical protein